MSVANINQKPTIDAWKKNRFTEKQIEKTKKKKQWTQTIELRNGSVKQWSATDHGFSPHVGGVQRFR